MTISEHLQLVPTNTRWLNIMAEKYHYMHKPVFVRACPFGWAITWDGELYNPQHEPYGFIIYASIHYTKLKGEFGYPGLPTKWQVLSLSRLWLHDDLPRNSETYVIARSLRLVQRRWIEIHPPPRIDDPYHILKVISYADTRYHSGTIYRAANFREVARVKSPTRGSPTRGQGAQNAELICFAYDLKRPNWHYQPEETPPPLSIEKESPKMQMSLFEEVPNKISWSDMVLSVSTDQDQLIRNIMRLHNHNQAFDLDPTYSKGIFYRNLPQPLHKFDLKPQTEGVQEADARALPFEDGELGSIMFDPPFLNSYSNTNNGKIKDRFGTFASTEELWSFYWEALKEFYRILRPGGLLVFKCQDMVSSGKNWWSHRTIERYAEEIGYEQVDLFILVSKSVMFSPNMARQQHARKCHSFFFCFRKPHDKKATRKHKRAESLGQGLQPEHPTGLQA